MEAKRFSFRHLIPSDTRIDFVGSRFLWIALSFALVLASILLVFLKGIPLGVDFQGAP